MFVLSGVAKSYVESKLFLPFLISSTQHLWLSFLFLCFLIFPGPNKKIFIEILQEHANTFQKLMVIDVLQDFREHELL
jgi:hypothetical protein